MGFDLEGWKKKVGERLQGWKSRMKKAGVDSVYAFLSAATVWPVIEAAKKGEWAALAALGTALAGVGNNLLANRIQNWKDEADAARRIIEDAPKDPVLRDELDTLLQKLETVNLATQALDEADRQWFAETLRAELARLGSSTKFTATVIGSGAIAQGQGNVVTGAGGVAVGGDVHGNVYVGPPPKDPSEALVAYRRMLVASCRHLPLRGIDVGASDAAGGQERLDLAGIYVALDTNMQVITKLGKEAAKRGREYPEGRESRPFRALEAVAKNRHVVILGDPGSGKSTFVNHLALCLAANPLEPQAKWLSRVPD